MFRETQKPSRLCNADGGIDTISSLAKVGALDIWEMRGQHFPFEALNDASRGWWPREPNQPTSELVPPYFVAPLPSVQSASSGRMISRKPARRLR